MKLRYLILLSLLTMSVCSAQIPNAISYQGLIINPTTGETVANGTHSVKFAFYDALTDGNLKWQTSTIQVTTFKGLFSTIIPVPHNASWDQALFVELTSDGVVMNTRIQLTSVPYAMKANFANIASSVSAAGVIGTIADVNLSSHLQDLADGSLTGSKIGSGVDATNVTNGTLPISVLNEHLQDLADGSLSGEKIGDGINAASITRGTIPGEFIGAGIKASNITDISEGLIPNASLDSDLQDLADDGVLQASRLENLDASKITSGLFSDAMIPNLNASKISGGTLSNNLLDADVKDLADDGNLDASRITSGAFHPDRIPSLNASKISGGTLDNNLLDADVKDLAEDGEISATRITSGQFATARIPDLNASKITGGTFSSESLIPGLPASKILSGIFHVDRIPTLDASKITGGAVTGSGTTSRLPYWTGSGVLGASSLFWDATDGELGIGSTNPLASLDITHGAVHPAATAVRVRNLSTLAAAKTGIEVELNNTPDGQESKGINVTIHTTGNGIKNGIASTAYSNALSSNITTGIFGQAAGTGSGSHYGVRGFCTADGMTPNTYQYGVYGLVGGDATGIKTAVYGTAVGNSDYSAYGVRGVNNNDGAGDKFGMSGEVTSVGPGKHYGVYGSGSGGTETYGVYGSAESGGATVQTGVHGKGYSEQNVNVYGVHGEASGGIGPGFGSRFGVRGSAIGGTTSYGVYGYATNVAGPAYAVYADGNARVTGNLTVNGTIYNNGALTVIPSDRKLKKDIVPIPFTLQKILDLKPVNYFFRKSEFPALCLDEDKQFGLIAQEVQKIFPELVEEKSMPEYRDDAGRILQQGQSYKALDYTSLIPILIKGMQEQQNMIEEMKAEIKELKSGAGQKQFVKASLKN